MRGLPSLVLLQDLALPLRLHLPIPPQHRVMHANARPPSASIAHLLDYDLAARAIRNAIRANRVRNLEEELEK